MKQLSTLILLAVLCAGGAASAQCTSQAVTYDLTVAGNVTIAAQSSSNYMQGYVCNGGVLLDSAYCCTRFVNVDSGGTMMVGPASYGQAFVKSGGTFNGQGSSANWAVFYESGATVINHTGNSQVCPQITFAAGSCITGFHTVESSKPNVALIGTQLNFTFSTSVNAQIELYDASGKAVRAETISNSSTFAMNVADLANGIYMYRVMQNGEVISSDKLVLGQ